MYKYLLCRHTSLCNVSSKWLTYVENSLIELNLTDKWNSPPNSLDEKMSFKRLIKFKCRELFENSILDQIKDDNRCNNYRLFKCNVGFEDYLIILDQNETETMTKWRCRDHLLPINNAKFGPCNQGDLICHMCNLGEICDESHFLLRCDTFSQERHEYLSGKCSNTSFVEIMTCK